MRRAAPNNLNIEQSMVNFDETKKKNKLLNRVNIRFKSFHRWRNETKTPQLPNKNGSGGPMNFALLRLLTIIDHSIHSQHDRTMYERM